MDLVVGFEWVHFILHFILAGLAVLWRCERETDFVVGASIKLAIYSRNWRRHFSGSSDLIIIADL